VYISASKIDMLFEQLKLIQPNKRNSQFGFNSLILNGSINETREFSNSYQNKLVSVIKQLDKENLIGFCKENKPYIRETIQLSLRHIMHPYFPECLLSVGKIEDYIVVMVGNINDLDSKNLQSSMSLFFGPQFELLSDFQPLTLEELTKTKSINYKENNLGINKSFSPTISNMLSMAFPDISQKPISTSLVTFEFVAKRLSNFQYENRPFKKNIYATPLYLAMI
jgi:hypothetical protein